MFKCGKTTEIDDLRSEQLNNVSPQMAILWMKAAETMDRSTCNYITKMRKFRLIQKVFPNITFVLYV